MRENEGKQLVGQRGMTLVEIVASIALLGIIIASFLPLFSMCARMIAQATGKTINLFSSQNKLEVIAATKSGVLFADGSFIPLKDGEFPVNFPGYTSKNIAGATVKADDLNEFLAGVPRIKLNPYILDEGYSPAVVGGSTITINIEGRNTHFIPGETNVELRDRNGNRLFPATLALSVINKEAATLTLPLSLNNSDSPYDIRLTTMREVAETLLPVNLPQMMIIGDNGTILVSSDIDKCTYWEQRIIPSLTTNLHSVAYLKKSDTNQLWVIAGDSGRVITLGNEAGWTQHVVGSSHWNSIARGNVNGSELLVIVGDNGQIARSVNGKDWSWSISPTSNHLKKVFWGASGSESFWAVGENGTLLSSTDGKNWIWINQPVAENSLAANLNPVLWLDAGHGIIEQDGRLQTWNDRSSNNNDATAIPPITIPGTPPSINHFGPELSTNQINGKSAILFNEANDRLTIPNILAGGTSGRTIFLVTNPTNNNPIMTLNPTLPGNNYAITGETGVRISTSPSWYINYESGAIPGSFSLLTIANAPNARIKDISGYYHGTGQHIAGIGGANQQIDIPDSETCIGGSASDYFSGYIAEIIVFNRQLNFVERKQVEGYLAGKYGLTLGETLNAFNWGKNDPPSQQGYIITGENGTLLWSVDGTSWQSQVLLNVTRLNGIATMNNLMVTCGVDGSNGAIFSSSNGGANWIQQGVPPSTSELLDIIHCSYSSVQFMAVSKYGEILVSPEGTTWNTRKLLLPGRQLNGINIR